MESKHTKGIARIDGGTIEVRFSDETQSIYPVKTIATVNAIFMPREESKANAQLMVDAFNVTNETGLTPRELQKSHAELLEALELVYKQSGIIWDSKPLRDFEVGCMLHIITKAIKNATKSN